MHTKAPILVVEDDPDQLELIRQILATNRVVNRVVALSSGEEAIAYFSGAHPYEDRGAHPLPSLVLLDLKLGGMSGFEVLNWIRNNPTVQRLPVVVLTASNSESDLSRAYALGANSYLVKPFAIEELRALVKSIDAYWVILAEKPEV